MLSMMPVNTINLPSAAATIGCVLLMGRAPAARPDHVVIREIPTAMLATTH